MSLENEKLEETVPVAKKKFGISGSTVKMIAIISMLIDHTAATILERIMMLHGMGDLDPTNLAATMQWLSENKTIYIIYTVMRSIGRLGFPIFCFLLIQGFIYTRSRKKYAERLFLFALISEVPFDLAFKGKLLYMGYQNVFFTLFIGLLVMIAFAYIEQQVEWKKPVRILLYVIALAAGMGAAILLKTDYDWKGIVCIMALYIFRKNKVHQIIAGCVAFWFEVPFAQLAFIPIAFYNGKRGWNIKYFFYAFYPVHLFILYLICYFMGMGTVPGIA